MTETKTTQHDDIVTTHSASGYKLTNLQCPWHATTSLVNHTKPCCLLIMCS